MGKENSYWFELAKQGAWAAKTPIASGAVAAAAFWKIGSLYKEPWVIKQLAEAKAADEAYKAELLKAYKFTYPEDTNVTRQELSQFEYTARNIDQTFRESNFDYQNHVYDSLMKLYGSQQGTLEEAFQAAHTMNLAEQAIVSLGFVGVAAGAVLAISTICLPFKAHSMARYGYW